MEELIRRYARKLIEQGMADPGAPLLAGLDDEIWWTRTDPAIPLLLGVIERLNVNSLLHCRPAEPYGSMIEYLAARADGAIRPRDSETRTFLHDLPVADALGVEEVAGRLKRRKSVITPGGTVTTVGSVSPEEAFISFSSVCFACYVTFMADCLHAARRGTIGDEARAILRAALDALGPLPREVASSLAAGPLRDADEVHAQIAAAGGLVVRHGLVDSFFGNVSYLLGGTLHISQTGSSLDELAGCIDPCPLDGSSSAGITASSELTAHLRIAERTGARAILHGHPKIGVALSLDCEVEGCEGAGTCHLRCDRDRRIGDVPIVPGEVGTGRYGLCNQVPEAMVGRRGVMVHGHGLFTVGRDGFAEALEAMFDIETMCREELHRRVG